ncbi:MAG: four helix bundle protein [Vicinamibacterales bacterium]
MGASRFEELKAWQHADGVRKAIIEICRRPVVQRDFNFRSQIDGAGNSACRNLAEGFGRQSHAEFAHYCVISIGSLHELLDLFREGRLKGYISDEELQLLRDKTRRAIRVTHGLRRYLRGN